MKKIGMRNIKTAIAVVLALGISRLMKTEYPFYSAIAAIISMQSSIIESFRVGKNRMLGTIVGAAVGLIFFLISPGNLILSGIGIVVVIYICDSLGWNKAVSIACIVFCVIMTNLSGRNPFFYSISRILDTFIGIIIAVAVNYIIKPPNN
ncbi:FUSC family protein [Clostridium grantii]|uniref:Aromatic acid exporter family member 1 n=1 Tax=Clostridium grantii DSM 8605 TaxID=1121316 RepID=A0A1M5WFN1_9CLOT|nr:aromatic acid exporter family protein [Clostridium grantii]SHH86208.1 Aromatic acid exporter family member 1 [Clostridium grantii DSM 8605]